MFRAKQISNRREECLAYEFLENMEICIRFMYHVFESV